MVESALPLDVGELFRGGLLAHASRMRSVISWLGAAGKTAASVPYESDMMNSGEGRLRLRFSTFDPNSGGRRQVDQRATLAATRPGFGEERYWFADDGRRAARLHLPPSAISSGCGSRQKNAPQIRHANV